jgi:hypothetical protein
VSADDTWLPIPDYETYYSVTNNPPAIRSETRTITHPGPWGKPQIRTLKGRTLKTKPSGEVTLSRDNIAKTVRVHVVAALVFGAAA